MSFVRLFFKLFIRFLGQEDFKLMVYLEDLVGIKQVKLKCMYVCMYVCLYVCMYGGDE